MSWKRAALVASAVIAAAAAFAVWKIGGPEMLVGMLRYDDRREGSLHPGDAAPDVTVATLNGAPTRLSSFVGRRPLVLVFGSYT
jgi:hypothetical protein